MQLSAALKTHVRKSLIYCYLYEMRNEFLKLEDI